MLFSLGEDHLGTELLPHNLYLTNFTSERLSIAGFKEDVVKAKKAGFYPGCRKIPHAFIKDCNINKNKPSETPTSSQYTSLSKTAVTDNAAENFTDHIDSIDQPVSTPNSTKSKPRNTPISSSKKEDTASVDASVKKKKVLVTNALHTVIEDKYTAVSTDKYEIKDKPITSTRSVGKEKSDVTPAVSINGWV